MYAGRKVFAVIPARDEEAAIEQVVTSLTSLRIAPDQPPVFDGVVVCDNGSRDNTAAVARRCGAIVVAEPRPGYGNACLAAIAALPPTDFVVFIDGDNAFDVNQAVDLLNTLVAGADLAIGSRTLGCAETGSLTLPQRFGNHLAAFLIRRLWGTAVTDLGPYRAIRSAALRRLQMQDRTYGWTVEMQIKAIQLNFLVVERPVTTRRRIGRSKISGTVRGTLGAGYGILAMIFRLRYRQKRFLGRPALTRDS